ncbi:hypothetical protein IV203_002190 [Nitzschia inconspicua]|uniref:Uncharacterized protein n=1 Tax=Nitzschia inconspicua TaxID=303405 RepID=A0A9K3L8D1_9STRA|nr:hypothetical protein IV203_002190 [Nitzschia inconspicua]
MTSRQSSSQRIARVVSEDDGISPEAASTFSQVQRPTLYSCIVNNNNNQEQFLSPVSLCRILDGFELNVHGVYSFLDEYDNGSVPFYETDPPFLAAANASTPYHPTNPSPFPTVLMDRYRQNPFYDSFMGLNYQSFSPLCRNRNHGPKEETDPFHAAVNVSTPYLAMNSSPIPIDPMDRYRELPFYDLFEGWKNQSVSPLHQHRNHRLEEASSAGWNELHRQVMAATMIQRAARTFMFRQRSRKVVHGTSLGFTGGQQGQYDNPVGRSLLQSQMCCD